LKKKSNTKTSRKIKDKPESTCASIDNARHALATPDLSSLKRKADDDDMNDIMSVLDQITDKELTLLHTVPKRESFVRHIAQSLSPQQQLSERMLTTLSQQNSMLKHNKTSKY
jgi:FixJ family two-component response regulator